LSVNITEKLVENGFDNNKGVQATRPQTAKPMPKGDPIGIKQMVFFDGKDEAK